VDLLVLMGLMGLASHFGGYPLVMTVTVRYCIDGHRKFLDFPMKKMVDLSIVM
jgi:hypothetical protein